MQEPSPLKHFCCNDCFVLGTIESLHCGDGVIDDARIRGRDYRGNAAVNADRSLDGLASSLATWAFCRCISIGVERGLVRLRMGVV
jgi:hypothetical protein